MDRSSVDGPLSSTLDRSSVAGPLSRTLDRSSVAGPLSWTLDRSSVGGPLSWTLDRSWVGGPLSWTLDRSSVAGPLSWTLDIVAVECAIIGELAKAVAKVFHQFPSSSISSQKGTWRNNCFHHVVYCSVTCPYPKQYRLCYCRSLMPTKGQRFIWA